MQTLQVDEDEEIIYKIDIPANRYDMLCVEGIALALNIFRKKMPPPTYKVSPHPSVKMTVKPETALVRPFVVCAVLRGVTFTKERYDSFIDLQDKLHQNLWCALLALPRRAWPSALCQSVSGPVSWRSAGGGGGGAGSLQYKSPPPPFQVAI